MLKHTRNSAKRQFSKLTDTIGQFVVSEGERSSRGTVQFRKPISGNMKVEPEVVDCKKGKLTKGDIMLVKGNGEDMASFVHENQGEEIVLQAASETGNYVELSSPRRPPRHKKKSDKMHCKEISIKSKQHSLSDADQKSQALSQIGGAASAFSSIEKGNATKGSNIPITKKSTQTFSSRLDNLSNTKTKSFNADDLGEESIHLREIVNKGTEKDCNIEQEESFISVPMVHSLDSLAGRTGPKGSKIKPKREAPKPPNVASSTTIVYGRKGCGISKVKLKKQAPKPPNIRLSTDKDISSGKEHDIKSKKQAPTPPKCNKLESGLVSSKQLDRRDSWCELNLNEKVKKVKEETQILESMFTPSLEDNGDELSKKRDVMSREDLWTSDSLEDTPKVCVKDLQGEPTRSARIESRSENPATYFMAPVISVENPDDVEADTEKNTFDGNSRKDTKGKSTSVVCENRQKARKPSGETFWDKENDFVEGHSEHAVKKIGRAESHKAIPKSVKEKELAGNGTGDEEDTYSGYGISKFAVGSGIYHLVEIDMDTFSEENDCVTNMAENIGKVENEDDTTESRQIENVNSVEEDLSNIGEFERISDHVPAVDKLSSEVGLTKLDGTDKDKNALIDEVKHQEDNSTFKYLLAYSETFGTSVSDVEEDIVNEGEYLEEGEKTLEENDRSGQDVENNVTGYGVNTEMNNPNVDFNVYRKQYTSTENRSYTEKMQNDIDETISEQDIHSLEMKDAEEQQTTNNFQNTFHESVDYSAIDCVNDEVFCFAIVDRSEEVESGEFFHSFGVNILCYRYFVRTFPERIIISTI